MTELPLFDDSEVRNVLCVVAHPDDMEYGGSAAVARWIGNGATVTYLLLTRGEAGMREMEPAEVAALRQNEQQQACDTVGVQKLLFLDEPDGMMEHSLSLRKKIARVIRQVKPDTLMVTNWSEMVPWGLNQADHRVAGLATVDAARDADNPWVHRELETEEILPAWGASRLVIHGSAEPDHAIELNAENVERAVASLHCHEAYLAALPGHPDPREMITGLTRAGGEAADVEFALPVKIYGL